MNANEQDLIYSIELGLIELRAIGGADDRAVLHELRRVIGNFTSGGRVGTLNISGPAFDKETSIDPKIWGKTLTPWPARAT